MLRVGVTGVIGSGKSEVDRRLIVFRLLDHYVGLLVCRAPPVPMSAFIDFCSMRDL